MTKPNPNKPISRRDRVRAIIKPGSTIYGIAKALGISEHEASRTVSDLRALGEVTYPVAHTGSAPKVQNGQALRAALKGSVIVDTAMRDGFKRAVPADMMEMIAARVAAGQVTVCEPGGHYVTFRQGTAMFSRVEAA